MRTTHPFLSSLSSAKLSKITAHAKLKTLIAIASQNPVLLPSTKSVASLQSMILTMLTMERNAR
jgi:hypothetical protein